MSIIALEDDLLRVEFDCETGAIVGLLSKRTGWKIQRRPELGLSFRMLAPIPDRRNNPVLGGKQKCESCVRSEDDSRVTFVWEGLASEHGGTLDVSFTATAALVAGTLTFTGAVKNRSPYTIECVGYPCLGDIPMPSPEEPLRRLSDGGAGMRIVPLLPEFRNEYGYYGVDYPRNAVNIPQSPFVLIDSGEQGLYTGVHDTSLKEMVQFVFELKPGFRDGFNLWTAKTPPGDEISGQPVHMELAVNHFPFVAPGEEVSLSSIVLHPYVGTWHSGADCYKAWRATWYEPPKAPGWAREVHSWQQIHINSPEDELRYRYTELPQFGRECAKHGVKAIQLVGWNDGGQDRGNPSHDTDPRLGTWQKLRDAITTIHNMGIKLILFTKFTWSDRSTEWFRNELVRYSTKDPYDDPHWYVGYPYQTPTQLADINTRRFSPMCHLSPEWREIANAEFRKAIALGAAGMLYDEAQHHGPANLCFDPTHGHHVPAFVYAGDALLAEGLREIADDLSPDFLFAGEACYDLEYRHYEVSYVRLETDHIPLHRYIDPYRGIMAAVAGYDDRRTINMCLMYRYIISYEPLNFKGRLGDFPMTIEYGKKVDALRTRYGNYLWDAEFRDTLGACVTVNGKPHHPYSVFHEPRSGLRAVVVANDDDTEGVSVRIVPDGPCGPLTVATPEAPEARPADGPVTIPPRSVAVVMEQPSGSPPPGR